MVSTAQAANPEAQEAVAPNQEGRRDMVQFSILHIEIISKMKLVSINL